MDAGDAEECGAVAPSFVDTDGAFGGLPCLPATDVYVVRDVFGVDHVGC